MELVLETLELDPAIERLCRDVLATSSDYREAAARLGITQGALARYVEKYGLSWRPTRVEPPAITPEHALVLDVQTVAELERALCIRALARAGEVADAAGLLGLSEHALRRRIIVHRINPDLLPDLPD